MRSMWDPSYNESFQDTERVEPPSIGATALNNASQEQIRFEDMAKGDMSEDDSCKSRSLSTITIEKSPEKYVSNPAVQVK